MVEFVRVRVGYGSLVEVWLILVEVVLGWLFSPSYFPLPFLRFSLTLLLCYVAGRHILDSQKTVSFRNYR